MFCINNVVGEWKTLLIHNWDCQSLILWPEFRYPEVCPLWFPPVQSNKSRKKSVWELWTPPSLSHQSISQNNPHIQGQIVHKTVKLWPKKLRNKCTYMTIKSHCNIMLTGFLLVLKMMLVHMKFQRCVLPVTFWAARTRVLWFHATFMIQVSS